MTTKTEILVDFLEVANILYPANDHHRAAFSLRVAMLNQSHMRAFSRVAKHVVF